MLSRTAAVLGCRQASPSPFLWLPSLTPAGGLGGHVIQYWPLREPPRLLPLNCSRMGLSGKPSWLEFFFESVCTRTLESSLMLVSGS